MEGDSVQLDWSDIDSLGPYFGLDDARSLKTVPVRSAPVIATRILREVTEGDMPSVVLPRCDAYLLMVYLEDTSHSDIDAEGRLAPPRACGQGSVCIVDMRQGPAIALHHTLSSLAVLLPRSLIAEVAELSSPPLSGTLRCRRAEPDPVTSNLAVVMLSLFDSDLPSSATILQHVAIALCTHLLQDCLDGEPVQEALVMAYDREEAAKEFMRRNLARELPVSEIAAVAGVSANHFSQGFKKVTGMTPHQWLMHARVAAARDLLGQHDLSLREIAAACGFVDQSHFTRVFSREVGLTPAVWRARQVN